MPLRLEIKKLLASRSERVKACDLHPEEPWVLAALYTGHLFIWNYNTQTVVKTFEVCEQPLRCAKFIARKQWVICGADDMKVRVFNYNTMDKVAQFEAHMDYIRYLEVHPTQPYVLSTSDDMTIKLWNWEKDWANTQNFEGHSHYVMMVKFNPKDSNTFASASLDKSIKIWSLGSPIPNYSLEGHEKGVNAIDYYPGGDKPYLISGADDFLVKIWDYQTKSCVQTLDGHTNHVTSVCYHSKLPVLLTGGEDGTIRMWHSNTYRLETTLNYGMERVWSLCASSFSNKIAIGYDEGTIVLTLGKEMPSVSIDSSGKGLMTKNNEVVSFSLRGVATSGVEDGERIEYQTKELGSCEIYPQKIMHNNNGRFVVVCGDGEYIIYTSQALRNKAFGSGLDFGWSAFGTGDYAVRESSSRVRTFKNFKEAEIFNLPFTAESLYGGSLIGICGSEFVVFYDWDHCRLVMKIDVPPLDIIWSADGELVTLVCEDSFFVLKCNLDVINDAFANGTNSLEDGVEDSFVLLHEIAEQVVAGEWVGSCFIYVNKVNRVNYYVGGEVMTMCHLDGPKMPLGFVAKENRFFLVDKDRVITSHEMLESVLQYQTAVVRKDFESANQLLATIPRSKYNDISRFLESQGYKDVALQVAQDPDQKLDLAIQLEKLDVALSIMEKDIVPANSPDDIDVQSRWKQIGDLALSKGLLDLAEKCAQNASDLNGLLLMHSSSGNVDGIKQLAKLAEEQGKTNISFLCHLLLRDTATCIAILQKSHRFAEAALFARTFAPSHVEEAVVAWKKDLGSANQRAADALAVPSAYPDLFPSLQEAIEVENIRDRAHGSASSLIYASWVEHLDKVLLDVFRESGGAGVQAIYSSFGGSGGSNHAAEARKRQEEEQRRQQQLELEEQQRQQAAMEEQQRQQAAMEEQKRQKAAMEEQQRQQAAMEEQRRQQAALEEQKRQQAALEEQRRQQAALEEQKRQQAALEEQKRQQAALEEQKRQQAALEEQKRQQAALEEQRRQQAAALEEQQRQQAMEEQKRRQQAMEEQKRQHEEQMRQQEAAAAQAEEEELDDDLLGLEEDDDAQIGDNDGFGDDDEEFEDWS